MVIAVSTLLLGATLYGIQRLLITRSFASLEQRYARSDLNRAVSTLQAEGDRLDALAQAWASSDDMYRFASERNDEYLRTHLATATLAQLELNLVLVVDAANQIVFAQAADLQTGKALLVPEFSQEALLAGHPLLQFAPAGQRSGILLLSAGPMWVVARPIVTGAGEGPARGALVLGRLIDAALQQRLAKALQRPLVVRRVDDPALPADMRRALAALSATTPNLIQPQDQAVVAGYALLSDIQGQPALIVKTELPRDIYLFGQASFGYMVAAIVLVGVQFWAVAVLLLERTVLRRVKELGRQVGRLGEGGDLSLRLALQGQDEVGTLAGQINGMLTALQEAKESIRWRERYLEGLARAAQELVSSTADVPYDVFLRHLGEATRASHVAVFLNKHGLAGELVASMRAEWCAPGVTPLIGDPRLQNLSYVGAGLERRMKSLMRGEPVAGVSDEFRPADRALLEPLGIVSLLALPILADGAFVGVISFDQRDALRQWEPAEVDLLRSAAAALAQALTRKRNEKVQSATYRVSEAAHAAPNLQELFRSIHSIVGELMPAQCFSIALVNPATQALEFPYVVEGTEVLSEPHRLTKALTEYVLQSGETLLVPLHVFEKLRGGGDTSAAEAPSVDWLGVPLKLGLDGRPSGVLAVHSQSAGMRLGAEEQDILTFVSAQVAMAVERQLAAEETARLQVQLRQSQRIEAIGQLAGGVAHEFGNALTTILGNAELSLVRLAAAEPGSPLREGLLAIKESALRVSGLLQQLHAFGGHQPLRPAVLNLSEYVDGMRVELQEAVGDKVELQTELTPAPGPVLADPQSLRQSLLSLAHYACDAMPQGGTLRIETAQVTVDDAHCRAHPNARVGEYVRLTLADNGVGMEHVTLEHLFEPYSPGLGLAEGSGMHLAAVYGTITQHEGWIEVQSEPEHGSRFDLYLPLRDVAYGPTEQAPPARAPGQGGTLLLAEDEEAVREVTRRSLELLGYTVHAAANGEEALVMFADDPQRFDLLVLDAVMPRMSGPQAYEAMHALRPEVPVLFITAYGAQMQSLGFAQRVGFRVMSKPFTLDELEQTVRSALDEARRG
jgi:sensor domain CHASE-containing protein/signal transduction histidine kinase/ActR/RegA family two-component response regulator